MAFERDMAYPRAEPSPLPSYPSDVVRPAAPARAPLTKRMRTVHWMAIDFFAGAVAALFCLFAFMHSFGPGSTVLPVDLLLAAGVFFPVALRRRGPVVAYGVLIIVAAFVAFTGPAVQVMVYLAIAYVLYLVTTASNRRTGIAALALGLAVMAMIVVAAQVLRHTGDASAFIAVALALVIAWIIGHSARQRRLYARELQHQAASSAVAEERLRIARELHDVVAHSMSVIAVQAGYGQYVIDSSPADARDALGAIQATSRDALEEMRRMLGVLRQQDISQGTGRSKPAPLAPAPGLADLDRLVGRTCGAGVQVSVECSGLVRAVPAGIDLSAFRIIQEALTNVVKHAGGSARCTVSLRYGDTALVIRVTDDGGRSPAGTPAGAGAGVGVGAASSGGHGIIGMRERASLYGGEFSAGPLPDGGFQVAVRLPLLGAPPAPSAPSGPPVPSAPPGLPGPSTGSADELQAADAAAAAVPGGGGS